MDRRQNLVIRAVQSSRNFFLIREIGVSVALSSIRARTPFLCYNRFHQIQFLPQFVNC